jgi:arabinosaccharide transport system substrate-binding protein
MDETTLSRRDFLRLSALTAAGAALAACAPQATEAPEPTAEEPAAEEPTEAAPAEEAVELTIWTFGSFFTDYYEAIFPDYKEIAPHVTMQVEESGQMFDNLLAAFAAGTGAPDIADIEQGPMSRFFKGEIGLIDLTDLLQPHSDDYVMARTDPYSYQGKIYGVDHCLCPAAFYYRWDLFEEAGVEMPIATWDQFVEEGAKLQDVGAAALSLADRDWGHYHMLLIERETGGFFDPDGEVILDSDVHVDTLQWYVDTINSGVAVVNPEEIYAVLGEGKIAGQFGADWYGGFLRLNVPDGEGKWKAAPMPAWEPGGPRTSAHGGTGYTITRQSEAPEEAWKFIEFALFDLDNKYLEFTVNDLLPPIKSMLSDPRYLKPDEWYSGQPIGELYLELADEIPRHYRSPFFSETITLVGDAVYEAVVEGMDPRQALEDAADEARDLIAEG